MRCVPSAVKSSQFKHIFVRFCLNVFTFSTKTTFTQRDENKKSDDYFFYFEVKYDFYFSCQTYSNS